jgi:hypothetical protein
MCLQKMPLVLKQLFPKDFLPTLDAFYPFNAVLYYRTSLKRTLHISCTYLDCSCWDCDHIDFWAVTAFQRISVSIFRDKFVGSGTGLVMHADRKESAREVKCNKTALLSDLPFLVAGGKWNRNGGSYGLSQPTQHSKRI